MARAQIASTFKAQLSIWPREVAVILAARAALRVAPVLGGPSGQQVEGYTDRIVLPLFRGLASAWVAGTWPARRNELSVPASLASRAVSAAAFSAAKLGPGVSDAARSIRAAAFAADGARTSAARSFAADATRAAVYASADANNAFASDVDIFRQEQRIGNAPLWLGSASDRIRWEWKQLKSCLISQGQGWEVWTEWYEARLRGDPGNEDLEVARVMIAEEVWSAGPEVVNAHIKELIQSYRPQVPTVPDQVLAPVRVEERDGKIAQISDRDGGLTASERDFDGWREPVLDHVQELLAGDFHQGTNHGRVRERLSALGTLLPGAIPEVKERQYRLGYEIERFEGLLSAYGSGADDMPDLHAAVLEDLNRLCIALKMGIEKLERWAEFRRGAIGDPQQEGRVNPAIVARALAEIAAEMEKMPEYFNPELAESFRSLEDAVNDPHGATPVVVDGAVKSTRNVLSFLAPLALRASKFTAGVAGKVITAEVAKVLIGKLAAAALRISGALPSEWTWLRPLLEALARNVGG